MVMLLIQSLPYLSTVVTACISAWSYRRASVPVISAAISVEPELPKAA
jgi:hypothetical protein